MTVRVRFAPSPTGYLHLGGARTALFNFIFARSQNGVFILRIEDTDKERSKKEFEDDILENLNWLNLKWDEPVIRQSERTDLYKNVIKQLIDQKSAYYCFCSKEELELRKQEQLTRGMTPRYSGKCRNLTDSEVRDNLKKKMQYVIRLRAPEKIFVFNDFLRGEIKIDLSQVGDFIIAKNENEPLYLLANTVDDHYQGITHVIRGEEFISTTPKQILIYKYLDWQVPIFVHLPLVLGQDRSKLSKRHGAKSISEYKKEGYLPEAILNFIILLGWHPEKDREIISIDEAVKEFKLERLNKSPAVFNISKLNFLNRYYLKQKNPEEILPLIDFSLYGKFDGISLICQNGLVYSYEKLLKIINLAKERSFLVSNLLESVDFFFKDFDYPKGLLLWKQVDEKKIINNLIEIKDKLSNLEEEKFESLNIKRILDELSFSKDKGEYFWPLRVALSGKEYSPAPFDLAEIFGKSRTIELIDKAINLLKK